MKTVFNHVVELPKMKECRVDYKQMFGKTYAFLVNQITNDSYYFESGTFTIKSLYSEFKYCCLNELPIDTISNTIGVNIIQIENVKYR